MIKMDVPLNVKKDLQNFLPISMLNDLRCFAFHDHHPADQRNIDITICTARGEVVQLFQKEIVFSTSINTTIEPSTITNFRNNKCELFYLLKCGNELLILAGDLKCVHRLVDVERFEIDDGNFLGESNLKVWTTDDAVPTILNNNLEVECDTESKETQNIVAPVETKLETMVVQARYNLAHNVKTLQDLKMLRQEAAFKYYESLHSYWCKEIQCKDINEMMAILKMKINTQWIKVCNRKLVIALNMKREDRMAIEDIQVLLHTSECPTLTYTTKLFEPVEIGPFWCEVTVQSLPSNYTLVVVVALEELKYDALSRIQLSGVVSYKDKGIEKILPLETVTVSATDTMVGEYDPFLNDTLDRQSLLAILATSQANDLTILDISPSDTPRNSFTEAFCHHLKMERVCDNVLVHRVSAYHELYGVVMTFHESKMYGFEGIGKVTVYSRNDSQLLLLIHCAYAAIPNRLVTLPPDIRCSSRDSNIARQLQVLNKSRKQNISPLVDSLNNQMMSILQYYDRCMMKMNESGDDKIVNKIGVEIDIFACGKEKFNELKEQLRESMSRGLESLIAKEAMETSECMIVDSQE